MEDFEEVVQNIQLDVDSIFSLFFMFLWLRGCFYRRFVMFLALFILFLCGMCYVIYSNIVYLETGCNSLKV